MDVSRGEISRWGDGDSKPDAVHAIEFGKRPRAVRGRLDGDDYRACGARGYIFAFGSIEQKTYLPTWARTQPDNEADVKAALETIGTGYRYFENSNHTDQIRPIDGSSFLGRTLSVMGAPVGHKNDQTVRKLPDWVADAPESTRETFVMLLVGGRGYRSERRDTRFIETRRGQQYSSMWPT